MCIVRLKQDSPPIFLDLSQIHSSFILLKYLLFPLVNYHISSLDLLFSGQDVPVQFAVQFDVLAQLGVEEVDGVGNLGEIETLVL